MPSAELLTQLLAPTTSMNSELNLLVVSYTFPPDAEVGGMRVARFCRYLPEFGFRPVVLTVQEQFYRALDASRQPPSDLRVERTAMQTTPLDWYRQWIVRRKPTQVEEQESALPQASAEPGFLRQQALTLLQTPDAYWGWYRPAVRAGSRLIQQERISAIFSSGPPWTSHLVARRLARRFRLPWLADFRDPWAGNPWAKNLPAWRDPLDKWLEAKCVATASRVVCNTDRLRQFLAQRYKQASSEKFQTITNGFDDAPVTPPAKKVLGDQRLALHLGKIYSERKIDTFCGAVESLLKSGRIAAGSFRVLFLGSVDAKQAEASQQLAPQLFQGGGVEFQQRMEWSKAQEVLWSADLLLLFQGGFRMQIPAKFFEYWQTGKPIFVVAEEGALTDLLSETDSGIWADPGDAKGLADGFLRALELPARKPEEIQRQWASRYHFRALSSRLAQLLREICAAR